MNKKRRIVEVREGSLSKFLATPKDNTNVHSYVGMLQLRRNVFIFLAV